jgi:hypothetical protein
MYWTIDNFEQLTADQIIRMGVAHVLANGRASYGLKSNGGSGCMYDGIGCAAAPFLKPEHRAEADTGGSWAALADIDKVPGHHVDTIYALQSCHDSSTLAATNDADFIERFKDAIIDCFGAEFLPR